MNDSNESRRALYIGRFQVFHLGHLDVIKTIAAAPDVDEIVIAVGSAQYDHTQKHPSAPWSVNPFTMTERTEMIERSLEGELNKPYALHPVPDYHDWQKWHQHIERELPQFFCLYSADRKEREFFEDRGYQTRGFPRRFSFHAGSIRINLARGEDYSDTVPAGTLAVLERIGAEQRLRQLYLRDEAEQR